MSSKSGKHKNSPANSSAITTIKCVKCLQVVTKKDRKINCNTCYDAFHIECVSVTRLQYAQLLHKEWFCSASCKSSSAVPLNLEGNSIVLSEDIDNDSGSDNSDCEIDSRKEHSIADIAKSQKLISLQLEKLLHGNKVINQILLKNQQLEKRVNQLEVEIEILKQQSNDNLLLVSGIPELDNEDLTNTILNVSKLLKVDLEPSMIIDVTRLKTKSLSNTKNKKNNYNYPPPVIAKFTYDAVRTRFMTAKKNLGPIYTKQLFQNVSEENTLNFHSFLTPFYLNLLKKAKENLSDLGYKYIWYSNYNIRVRKNSTSQVISLQSEEDIVALASSNKQ